VLCLSSLLSKDEAITHVISSANEKPCYPCPLDTIRNLTRIALAHAGQSDGYNAMKTLGKLCKERISYDFAMDVNTQNGGRNWSTVSINRQLLSSHTTDALQKQIQFMEQNGWISTNPDSVDELPSLHLNLISKGKPIVSTSINNSDSFQKGISSLLDIVQPVITKNLVPWVKKMLNSTDIRVSEVFLRRYGDSVLNGEASRHSISAHYDVFSKVTAVIALDDVASSGRNGLYTTAFSTSHDSGNAGTSNHASLRRFFPLRKGDGVLHTWDVLHGVDVEPGIDRTSLVVWFSTAEAMVDDTSVNNCKLDCGNTNPPIAPWLSNHPELESDDIVQFVLASAIQSSSNYDQDDESHLQSKASMYQEKAFRENVENQIQLSHDLYIKSASKKNVFALTRVGSLCRDQLFSRQQLDIVKTIAFEFPAPPPVIAPLLDDESDHVILARKFWLESAINGNPLAQLLLGDEVMEVAVNQNSPTLRLLASTLFSLASQQSDDSAKEALSRLLSYEASISESFEIFQSSPVVRVASLEL
jgi:hypothetical protein